MRTTLCSVLSAGLSASLLAGVLAGGLVAQSPSPVKPAEKPAKQEPAKPTPAKPTPAKNKPVKGEPQQPEKSGEKGPDKKPVIVTEAPDDIPIPASADPGDIAAIQSASKMRAAERRLKEMLQKGEIDGMDKILSFEEIESWPYQDGLKGMPKDLKKLDGQRVLMVGFMLPIDKVQDIDEFLLVQSLWACCFGQPPDINGLVRVVMPKGKTSAFFYDPLKIVGTFKVEATMLDGYCVDIFQLHVESMEPLR